jgi:predicted DNA-binding protein
MGGKRGGYDEMEDRLNDLAKRVVKLKGMYRKMRRRIY